MMNIQKNAPKIIRVTLPFIASWMIAVSDEIAMIEMTNSSATHPIPFTETSDAL